MTIAICYIPFSENNKKISKNYDHNCAQIAIITSIPAVLYTARIIVDIIIWCNLPSLVKTCTLYQ